ncbi:MAG: alpha/beta hydrolase [Caldilineaceae bacterium]
MENPTRLRRQRIATVLVLFCLVLALGFLGFMGWALRAASPMPEALTALQSDSAVEVHEKPWLIFSPLTTTTTSGLILYPGARVDPRAYAPAAHAIAAQGFQVIIVAMPLNLAIMAPDRASNVIAAYPAITHWAIGGHSLGGAMAARYAHNHPKQVDALILWAAYPGQGDSLVDQTALVVTSISGTADGLATPEKIDASRRLLPPDTTFVAIDGGNHAQFGWYGPQSGDNPATISREEQQQQIVAATLATLRAME